MSEAQMQDDIDAIRAMVSGGSSKPTDKKAKILERVRGILALADDEQLRNPDAAENYRQQADKLMTAYAIEQWQVDQAQAGVNARPEPEVRFMDFEWFYKNKFSGNLWSMFLEVARHCRCVVAIRGHGKDGSSYRQIPVIGLSSDIDYFDMLFTHLMLQMGRQLEPKPELHESFGANAYRLRASGMARPRIAKLLYDLGMIPGTDQGSPYWDEESEARLAYERLPGNKKKSLRAKVRVAGEKFARENGHDPTTTVNPGVWQRSFAYGFVEEIAQRLWTMRKLQEEGSGGSGSSTALALRDIYQMAVELYREKWPEPKAVEVGSSNRGRSVTRSVKYSGKAMNAGREAGRKADLANKPGGRIGNPRGLPGG